MKEFDGLAASAITITHLKRELVQKVWGLLLDDAFMEVYKHGIVIICADGVTRRIYPRFSHIQRITQRSVSVDIYYYIVLTLNSPE